jgi:3-deoxy-D-manno-octulosonic-acid transferase
LLRRKLLRRAQQEPAYGLKLAERFGHYTGELPETGFVWLHAVSLGETRAAAILLPALREAFPGMRLLLTHSTATGWVQGQALLQAGDVQTWLPWDTARATQHFIRHFKPRMGLLMETEVWPQLVQACRRAQVPVCLLNARMSEKSWRQAKRWPKLSGPAYRGLSLVLAQSSQDAQGLLGLGCAAVQVVGNLKFDVLVPDQARALAARWQGVLAARPVVMLASTREGEEALWLRTLQSDPERWARLKSLGVLWLVVPRHPQRFQEVQALLEKAGLRCVRRSTWAQEAPHALQIGAADAIVGDSLGEMQAYYLTSRMALLGGSFEPLGGQNLIEAAACACPVVMGPHTFNFSEAAAWAVQVGAAWPVQDMSAALDHVVLALTDPSWLAKAQSATFEMMGRGRGSVAEHTTALRLLAKDLPSWGRV